MVVGSSTNSTRVNERNAMLLLVNPNNLLAEWIELYHKLMNRTTVIKPATYESSDDEEEEIVNEMRIPRLL
ncbi:unnamed protein product [Adineta ricciae]|uniref:Uncharacterized protein n=1 Tax=Adineta ricciae TaxID=249248 RepID=A0A814UF87_ADIRI|nr:unnamed protein product [Adineta ricciae]